MMKHPKVMLFLVGGFAVSGLLLLIIHFWDNIIPSGMSSRKSDLTNEILENCDPTKNRTYNNPLDEGVYCPKYSCWESTLRLKNQILLEKVYNRYRNHIALSQNITNVVYVRNVDSIRTEYLLPYPCGTGPVSHPFLQRHYGDIGKVACGTRKISFKQDRGIQAGLIDILPNLILKNELEDFFPTGKFRRAGIDYFGCRYLLRINASGDTSVDGAVVKGHIGHLTCTYCAKTNDSLYVTPIIGDPSSAKDCPENYYKDPENSQFKYLCKPKETSPLLACENDFPKCVGKPVLSWMSYFDEKKDSRSQLWIKLNGPIKRALIVIISSGGVFFVILLMFYAGFIILTTPVVPDV